MGTLWLLGTPSAIFNATTTTTQLILLDFHDNILGNLPLVRSMGKCDHYCWRLVSEYTLPTYTRVSKKSVILVKSWGSRLIRGATYTQTYTVLELITPHNPTHSLRSANKHLLKVPDIRSANGRRSFSFAAPTVWNSLPLPLRTSPSLPIFLSQLKTLLFPS